jgi:hypothetical protein
LDLPRGLLRVRIAADRLVLSGGLIGIFDRRLVPGGLIRIIHGLFPLRLIDRLAGIAVAAGVLGVPG